MGNITREEKLKLLEKLPQHLQDLFYSEDTGATLLYLGKKYHLSDHQVRLLSKILGNVILGIVPIANLPLEISTKVAVDMQTASDLVKDLNDLILSPKPAPATTVPTLVPTPTPIPAPVTPKAPEVIDLRKTPVAPAPVPPRPYVSTPIKPPVVPLIEAEPHKIVPPSNDAYREDVLDLRKDKGEF